MYRTINAFIEKYGYESYLEIGIAKGNTFNRVVCKSKVGVDPFPQVDPISTNSTVFAVTSDGYFDSHHAFVGYRQYDVVFIDGLHHAEQLTRDIQNSLDCLNYGGTVLVHDVNPKTKEAAGREPPASGGAWNGDVWRAWVPVIDLNETPRIYTIGPGHGLGVMENIQPDEINVGVPMSADCWEEFVINRIEWLRLR